MQYIFVIEGIPNITNIRIVLPYLSDEEIDETSHSLSFDMLVPTEQVEKIGFEHIKEWVMPGLEKSLGELYQLDDDGKAKKIWDVEGIVPTLVTWENKNFNDFTKYSFSFYIDALIRNSVIL